MTIERFVRVCTKGRDLLAMRTHGRSGFSRLIKGCVSLDLVKSLKIPILTIRVK
jgi:nucleotide-binding universal stress UspA family protein